MCCYCCTVLYSCAVSRTQHLPAVTRVNSGANETVAKQSSTWLATGWYDAQATAADAPPVVGAIAVLNQVAVSGDVQPLRSETVWRNKTVSFDDLTLKAGDSYQLCFTAIDAAGRASEERCTSTVLVGAVHTTVYQETTLMISSVDQANFVRAGQFTHRQQPVECIPC